MKNYIFFCLCLIFHTIHPTPVAVTDGGTGFATATTAYAVICGGTTTVTPFQPTASAGTSGQPLLSAGAGALPAYGTLSIAGGGTGATTLSSGVIQSNGSVLSSLGIGSANQVLQNVAGTVGWAFTNILQMVSTSTSSQVTVSSVIPNDNTIPQSSEGTSVLSLSITPKSSSSNLLIMFGTGGTPSATTASIAALFKDSDTDAIATQYLSQDSSTRAYSGTLTFVVASGSTTARTYTIRVGCNNYFLNGTTSSRSFGGVASTMLIIIEFT